MAIVLRMPGIGELGEAVDVLRDWQYDGAPKQLHPGELGWFWRFGAETTSEAVRTWSRNGQILAIGLLDGAQLLRLAIAPDAHRDEELAQHRKLQHRCRCHLHVGRLPAISRDSGPMPGRCRRIIRLAGHGSERTFR